MKTEFTASHEPAYFGRQAAPANCWVKVAVLLAVVNLFFLVGICGFIAYQTHRVNAFDADALFERGVDAALRSPRLRSLSQNLTSTLISLFNPLPVDAPQLLNYVLHSNLSTVLVSLAPLVESWSMALNDTFFAEKLADPFWSVAEVMRILSDVEWLRPVQYQPQSLWGVLAVSLLNNTGFPINNGQQSQLAATLIQVCTALQNVDWTFTGIHGQQRDLTGPICMVTNKIITVAEALQKQHGQLVLPRASSPCTECKYKFWNQGCAQCIIGGCTWCDTTYKCTSASDTSCSQPSQSCDCWDWPDCNSCIRDASKSCFWCNFGGGYQVCQSGSSSQCAQTCSMRNANSTSVQQ